MKIKKLPGRVNWYHGNGNDIAIGRFHCLDDDRTKVDVFIRDRLGNITHQIGNGRQIGNTHPVWVRWNGNKTTVEDILKGVVNAHIGTANQGSIVDKTR